MKILEVIWLENIVTKLKTKHDVYKNEIIEVLNNSPLFLFVENGFITGENVYSALGKTASGRYLIVFFVYKKNCNIIVISARNMTKNEKKRYEKK